jgi:glycosyltransferase involved in cell wall biosynthesis
MARVSVIVTSFNSGPFLQRAVRTVLAQTVTDIEIVVVDDGSTVPQPDIELLDSRIRFVRQRINRGVSVARNVGALMATADLIAFIDHDDEWHPDKLAVQLGLVAANPEAAFWSTAFDWVFGDQTFPSDGAPPTYLGLLSNQTVLLSSVLLRRSDYFEVGGHNPLLTHMEDQDLLLRLAMEGRQVVASAERLVRYNVHGSNASRDYRLAAASRLSILAAHGRLARRRNDGAALIAIKLGRARTRELLAFQAVDAARKAAPTDVRAALRHFALAFRTQPRVAAASAEQFVVKKLRMQTTSGATRESRPRGSRD